MSIQTDTIAAVATPAGPGAIGILRLSGPRAADIAAAVFRPLGKKGLLDRPVRTLVYGDLLDREGQVIDRVLCTYSRGPESYTGEDTAELHCHGSPMVLTLGLEALFAQGARQAGPGEFTQRAFLNGRLDLAQAEAVADLLDAQSREGARHAAGQLSGALSRRVGEIYSALVDLMAHFHAVLDYPDEDIDPFRAETMETALSSAQRELSSLLATYGRGRQLAHGVPCAIVGRPNAGKSSLLNALVGYDRAIVTDIPGTTRDTIEEKCRLGGVLLRLIDTAGLRATDDPVERLGVERSRAALKEAGLALVLIDPQGGVTEEDLAILAQARSAAEKVIVVLTKADLNNGEDTSPSLRGENCPPVVSLSARTGEGLKELEEVVAALFPQGEENWGELLTNARQAEAAGRALGAVESARSALAAGMPADAVFSDVEAALDALGALTGRSVREDVTDRIFSRFCVGK